MAAITLQRLRQIIEIAYESGYHGCLDMKNVYAEEIIQNLLDSPAEPVLNKNDGWRVYKVKELRVVAPGTMYEHLTRGRGYIETEGLERVMRWSDGTCTRFVTDEPPWTDPMRPLGMTMKIEPKEPPKRRPRRLGSFL